MYRLEYLRSPSGKTLLNLGFRSQVVKWLRLDIVWKNGLEIANSIRTLPIQPLSRYPLCLCQHSHCTVLVCTSNPDFEILTTQMELTARMSNYKHCKLKKVEVLAKTSKINCSASILTWNIGFCKQFNKIGPEGFVLALGTTTKT